MNVIRAIFMEDRSSSIKAGCVAAALATGMVALSLMFVLPVAPQVQHTTGAGASVHAKNGATPDWILDLQTRNAGQPPVTVQNDEPSFWI
jgi:hypothetical protein